MDQQDEGLKSTSRRDFLRKAVVYGPPTILAGQLLFTGVAWASSADESSSSEAGSSESGDSSSSTPVAAGPLGTLQDDLLQLQSHGTTGSKSGDNKLAAAVADLTSATDVSLWVDDYDVIAGTGGHSVFVSVLDAYDKLAAIPGGVPATLSGVPSDFVSALSTVASNAVTAGLSQAATDAANGDYDDALKGLRHIWHGSTKAPLS